MYIPVVDMMSMYFSYFAMAVFSVFGSILQNHKNSFRLNRAFHGFP